MIRGNVLTVSVLRKARGRMAQRIFKALLEVAAAIVRRQQCRFVQPQIFFCGLAVYDLRYSIAQGIVAILDQIRRRLHSQQPTLSAVLVLSNVVTVSFLSEVAVNVVLIGDVTVLRQLICYVVAGRLRGDASAVIFVHNHPSDNCEPSEADRTITQRLKEALTLVDIRVLDHFIVSRSSWVSLAERGCI